MGKPSAEGLAVLTNDGGVLVGEVGGEGIPGVVAGGCMVMLISASPGCSPAPLACTSTIILSVTV